MIDEDLIRRGDAARVAGQFVQEIVDHPRLSNVRADEIEVAIRALPAHVQCCMCGKRDLSTVEGDGGEECELHDGRWTCSRACYDRATEPAPVAVETVTPSGGCGPDGPHDSAGYFPSDARPVAEVQAEAVAGAYAAIAGDAGRKAIAEALGDAMDCIRDWSAWHVGTMRDEDFLHVADDDNRLSEIQGAILALTPADAAAALDRIRAEARKAEAYRIAEMVRGWRNDIPMTGEECADTILAMIKETINEPQRV